MATPGDIPETDWAKAKQYGVKYGVDPLLLVAIGFQETNWGKAGLGRQGLILGVGAYDSGPVMTWKGLDKQLDQGAKILKKHDVTRIEDVRAGKAKFWATSPGWKDGVSKQYDRLLKTLKGGWKIPGTDIAVNNPVPDVTGSIASAVNAFLQQFYKLGISFAVLIGAGLLIVLGVVILLRAPLARASSKVAQTVGDIK